MSRFTPHVCRTAGTAVCNSRSLEEALDQNPYEGVTKRSVWDKVCVSLWQIKASMDHTEQVNRIREAQPC